MKHNYTFKSFEELRNHFNLRENVWELTELAPNVTKKGLNPKSFRNSKKTIKTF